VDPITSNKTNNQLVPTSFWKIAKKNDLYHPVFDSLYRHNQHMVSADGISRWYQQMVSADGISRWYEQMV